MEVIYTPPWQDDRRGGEARARGRRRRRVGISSLATDHLIVPKLMSALRDAGLGDMSRSSSAASFRTTRTSACCSRAGVRQVFHPGGTMDEITTTIRDYALEARRAGARADQGARHEQARRTAVRGRRGRRARKARWEASTREAIGDRPRRSRTSPASRSSRSTRPHDWAGYAPRRRRSAIPASPTTRAASTPTMHRGRTWTQRQLIGLGTPADYNARLLGDPGARRDRGLADPVQLGLPRLRHGRGRRRAARHLRRRRQQRPTTWTAASTASTSTRIVLRDERSVAVHAARLHAGRRPKRRGIAWNAITGTSNQSDYLSHFVANHMFFRLALPGARRDADGPHRLLQRSTCRAGTRCRWSASTCSRPARRRPRRWRFTLATAIQYAERLHRPRHGPRRVPAALHVLLRHLAQLLRGGRQVPRRPAHLGAARARAPRRARTRARGASSSTRQTSGVDLTRQQPLNNIARVTAQAMAGIFGGLQSLHTDAYDEVLSGADARPARASRSRRRTSCARRRT